MENTEILSEDTEIVYDTEISDNDFSVKLDEILNLLNGGADSDEVAYPEEESLRSPDGFATLEESAVDYSIYMEKDNECLIVIVMILIFWFCVWMLDKWRVWTVKGGK